MHQKVNQIRQQFTALAQYHNQNPVIFFDGPGGTQVPTSVLKAMQAYLGRYNSNLGGYFFSSQYTTSLLQQARQSMQALVNAPTENSIIFGANMTSLCLQFSRTISRDWLKNEEVILTSLDHYANVSPWQLAAEDKGVTTHQVSIHPATGQLNMEHYYSLLSDKTRFVAVTAASNVTGSLVDLESIIQEAHKVGAVVCVDAVHLTPHQLIDVQKLNCDFLFCSAYKFFGPHLGIAYVAPQHLTTLNPYKVEPATNQPPGCFETGTQNFEALAGLVACIQYLAQWGESSRSLRERLKQSYDQYKLHEQALSQYFLSKLKAYRDVSLHGLAQSDALLRTPTFALTFNSISSHSMAKKLAEFNICVWSGHFYAIGLVRQLGLDDNDGIVRIGFMHYNTIEEIDRLFVAFDDIGIQ